MTDAHIFAIVLLHRGDEARVSLAASIKRVRIGIYQTVGTFVMRTYDRVVGDRGAADERLLHAQSARLLGEFQRIGAREDLTYDITLGNLRDIGCVIGGVQGRP